MALGYHTFGPCTPNVGTGASNAMEALGLTVGEGRVFITREQKGVMSDAGGDVEAEIQAMGSRARIEMELASWDDAILSKLEAAAEGGATEGLGVQTGALLGTGGFLKGLYLPSSTDLPWFFLTTKLLDSGHNPGTAWGKRRVVFSAIRFIPGTAITAAGVYLYKRAAPP